MAGSIRQRGSNSWQIRVYAGTDPDTGQRRQLTRTVQGSRTQARRELRSFAAFANIGPSVGARATLGELLDRWFAAMRPTGPPPPFAAPGPTKTRRSHRVALDPYTQHLLEEQWDLIGSVAIGDLDGDAQPASSISAYTTSVISWRLRRLGQVSPCP